jgi:hypothetical protein
MLMQIEQQFTVPPSIGQVPQQVSQQLQQ